MNTLILILGVLLVLLFFLNIKSAADALCRIIGGFAVLFIYNYFAGMFSQAAVGINLISAIVCGTLGLPGGILLFCAALFL